MKKHLALLSLLALAACAVKPAEAPCPAAGYVPLAADTALFEPVQEKGKIVNRVHLRASLDNLARSCRMAGPDMLEVNLAFAVRATKDKTMAATERYDAPYFVALLGPNDEVLRKSTFTAAVPFDDGDAKQNPLTGEVFGLAREEHEIRIPVSNRAEIARHKIAVGFVLTPEQLEHNKRLSFGEKVSRVLREAY